MHSISQHLSDYFNMHNLLIISTAPLPDSENTATTFPITQHNDTSRRDLRSTRQTFKSREPAPCPGTNVFSSFRKNTKKPFSNAGNRNKKTTAPVEVLEEPQRVSSPTEIGGSNGTLTSNSFASNDQENIAPEDDGFQVPAYQKRKAKTDFRKAAVDNAEFEVERIRAQDRRDPGWKPRIRDAEAVLAQARKEQKRREALQQKANEAARPRNKSTAVIGKHGHRYMSEDREKTKFNGVRFSDQLPGTIFWHEEIYKLEPNNPKVKRGDKNTFQDHHGVWRYAKDRFFIGYGRQYAQINEVGIYTKGDTGAANIPEEELCEYINLKPKGAVDYEPQIPGAPTLEVQTKLGRRFMGRTTMLVRVARPTTRDLDCDELEMIGSITDDSLKILIEQVNKFSGRNAPAEKNRT
ncbi:hypothetical protein HII31_01207 [Pseudocercospora fuligena]|uniref:Uncharacterized protein n=1 Tax=Pseudocercospora fuligena TaxID=685502 RepID=A0A8H6VP33_9PEZI|nr:hypothetical protein HII31_01207 [Pseudocercospora fuligena]